MPPTVPTMLTATLAILQSQRDQFLNSITDLQARLTIAEATLAIRETEIAAMHTNAASQRIDPA